MSERLCPHGKLSVAECDICGGEQDIKRYIEILKAMPAKINIALLKESLEAGGWSRVAVEFIISAVVAKTEAK